MTILYIGDTHPSSGAAQRARAFERLGHAVMRLDPEKALLRSRVGVIFHYRTGYSFLQQRVQNWLSALISDQVFDIAWVDSGSVIGPAIVKLLRRHAGSVINYNCDDPTGTRDPGRWKSFRQAIPDYDALIAVRDESFSEYYKFGAKKVVQVMRSYDEFDLARPSLTVQELQKWSSDVIFVGTWMPERGPFLVDLVDRGVPLSIYGDRWRKAPEWKNLQLAYRGPAVEGSDYVAAIKGAKIALGLLSRGNRDQHTIRSSEVTYIGTLFCAERTCEHAAMYNEGSEAIFWSSADECARLCCELLSDEDRRKKIAQAGHEKIKRLGLSHTQVISRILNDIIR